MLLAVSISLMLCAVTCVYCERKRRYLHLSRHLLVFSGFFVALSFVSAAWWVWRL